MSNGTPEGLLDAPAHRGTPPPSELAQACVEQTALKLPE